MEIGNLGIFFVLFYVKYCFLCLSAKDLDTMQLFERAEMALKYSAINNLVKVTKEKLNNQLWYLHERLVPLTLFSNRVIENEKEQMKMARNMAKYKPPTIVDLESTQDMPSTNSFKK